MLIPVQLRAQRGLSIPVDCVCASTDQLSLKGTPDRERSRERRDWRLEMEKGVYRKLKDGVVS
jgi:hypothetical protein